MPGQNAGMRIGRLPAKVKYNPCNAFHAATNSSAYLSKSCTRSNERLARKSDRIHWPIQVPFLKGEWPAVSVTFRMHGPPAGNTMAVRFMRRAVKKYNNARHCPMNKSSE